MPQPRILFTWELGGGQGHIANIAPMAFRFVQKGWHVVCAIKELSKSRLLRAIPEVQVIQSPVQIRRPTARIPAPLSFCHLLWNVGYGQPQNLDALVSGWRDLYELVHPNAIVFEHSPTAMLAARHLSIPQFTMGTGFCQPPSIAPLPPMAPWRQASTEELASFEAPLVAQINSIIGNAGKGSLGSLSELYSQVDANFLNTFAELDHYPQRQTYEYLGPVDLTSITKKELNQIIWPDGDGPKVLAYLNPMKGLETLVRWLSGNRIPTILIGNTETIDPVRPHAGPSVRLTDQTIDLAQIRQQCDIAILNGSHSLSAQLLLAGKPTLQLPIHLEQIILSTRLVEMGVGLAASPHDGSQVLAGLNALIGNLEFNMRAREFSQRNASMTSEIALTTMESKIVNAVG